MTKKILNPNLQAHLLNSISKEQWRNFGTHPRAGVLIPLFSVYSKDSFGIGDFADLKLVIDWAKLSGNSIIQLLPLNELGGLNCPYDSVSSFALEPAYICLKKLGDASVVFQPLSSRKTTEASPCFLDYSVKQEKLRLLWEHFLPLDLSENEEFEQFQVENAYWLRGFAFFKVLKDKYQGKPWYEWEEKFKLRNPAALEVFQQENIEAITFQMWLQWIIFTQFKEAKAYAKKNNILIKGDLPILVSGDSADVWAHAELFKLDSASGAPPDMYCSKGQRWGMPTYNWENIAAGNFSYIKEKLKYAENFYDLLRIDHVVGLFRIWSIPGNDNLENQGLNGKFDPFDERLWCEHGQKILKVLIENTKMLLCAEDLGVIPRCCTDTLRDFGIPGNDVQRWVKDWNCRHNFLMPNEYREQAVATLSTHDTTSWKAWWQYEAGTVDRDLFILKCNDRKIDFERVCAKLFNAKFSSHGRLRWKKEIDCADKLLWELGRSREEVGDFVELYENTYGEKEKLWVLLGCNGEITEEASKDLLKRVIEFTLNSRAIFCIQSINDYLDMAGLFTGDSYQYRINTPGTISNKNWSLRLPLSLEELLTHPINKEIRKLITDSGRC